MCICHHSHFAFLFSSFGGLERDNAGKEGWNEGSEGSVCGHVGICDGDHVGGDVHVGGWGCCLGVLGMSRGAHPHGGMCGGIMYYKHETFMVYYSNNR